MATVNIADVEDGTRVYPGMVTLRDAAGAVELWKDGAHVATVSGRGVLTLEDGAHGERPARVYPTGDTFAYRCTCGHVEGDYLVREYAQDGWREHAGLAPLINYPMV